MIPLENSNSTIAAPATSSPICLGDDNGVLSIVQGIKRTYAACTKPTRCYPITLAQLHLAQALCPSLDGRQGTSLRVAVDATTVQEGMTSGKRGFSPLNTPRVGTTPFCPSLSLKLLLAAPVSGSQVPRPQYLSPGHDYHPHATFLITYTTPFSTHGSLVLLIAGTDISEQTHLSSL
jgi:hypothetical protein